MDKEKRMRDAVKYLKKYMRTYDKQYNYQKYSDETYINDVLYGLGASLGNQYKFVEGYDNFKIVLRKILEIEPTKKASHE